ncbi:hypothetical protein SCP_0503180 [Sparassis crispa]|uniref:Uncharacterized protein n=1 Tax=Sparassis crispa TaxID=139825 RepID=A0A401GM72_9APHY|nr:hypothetical protein SCP_0503180 [Sparassis crispa]GBE83270.1 hypothetical protein SCP_0503180 [Sparassis crispa]
MAPLPWANDTELDWLNEQLPRFLDHQKCKKLQSFFRVLYTDWSTQFPERIRLFPDIDPMAQLTTEQDHVLTDAIARRQKQLYNWYNNHKPKGCSADKTATTILKNFISKDAVQSKRLLQEVEAYSRKYYVEKVQASVKAEIKEKKIKKGESLHVIRRRTQAAYDKETPEVKAEILAAMEQEKAAREADALQIEDAHAQGECSPVEYQKMLDCIPSAIEQFFGALARKTGWKFSVFGGGPSPVDGGNLRSMAYHVGDSPNTIKFCDTMHDFEAHYMEPFGHFLTSVYCERALVTSPAGSSTLTEDVTVLDLDALRYRMEGEPSTEEPQAGPSSSTSSRPLPSDDEGEHDLLSDVSPRGPVQLPPSPMPSDDSSALTSVHYTAAHDSDSGTSGRSNPAPAVPGPSPSHVCPPVSANATVTWEPAPALWQFDVLLAPFQFDLDLQLLSLDDALLRMQRDDANKLTGAFNLTSSVHAAVPFSLDSGSEMSPGVPLRALSSNMHTSSPSPSVSVPSARSPSALSPSALSPHVPSPPAPSPSVPSLPAPSHSTPSPLISSPSAPSLTLTPSGPSMPISSVRAPSASMPSPPRSSASGVPAPSVLVCPEPVDVSLSALTSVSSSTRGCR